LLMKKQENKNWFTFIFTLFMHLKNADNSRIESVSLIEREQDMRREKYLKITKSEIYKNHNS
jgi:competence protein ComGF